MLFDGGSLTDVRRDIESMCHLSSHYQSGITLESESIIQIPGLYFLCMRKLPVGSICLPSSF